jgi:hypothetical protein
MVGIASYQIAGLNSTQAGYLMMCQFELLYFYLSCASTLGREKFDSLKAVDFNMMLHNNVASQLVWEILRQVRTPPKDLLSDCKEWVAKAVPKYDRLYEEQQERNSSFNHRLEYLARRLAFFMGAVTKEEYDKDVTNDGFSAGVKAVVEYDLAAMDLDGILNAIENPRG